MRRVIILILISVFILLLTGCGSKNSAEYKEKSLELSDKILANSADVEDLLNLYSVVWNHSIKSKGAIPVSEMVILTGIGSDVIKEYFVINSAGNIPDDFSTNIYSLKDYFEGTDKLIKIQNVANDIKESISELNDPPEEFNKTYDELLDMYNLSEEFIEMAINPDGSLQSFNENKNKISSDILSKHKRIEVIIPN